MTTVDYQLLPVTTRVKNRNGFYYRYYRYYHDYRYYRYYRSGEPPRQRERFSGSLPLYPVTTLTIQTRTRSFPELGSQP